MTRRRWLRVRWPFDMRTLAERLRAIPFTAATQNGFILDRVRPNSLEGRFIERQDISQIVESPLGEKVVYERTEFRGIGFAVNPSYSDLEIINPPRSISLFLSRLGEACNFEVSVSEIKVDVIRWCELFSKETNRDIKIVSCQMRDIKLTESVMATAILRGANDVRLAADKLTNGASYTNDKIRVQIEGSPINTLILTRQGSASIDKSASEPLLEALRRSLRYSLD